MAFVRNILSWIVFSCRVVYLFERNLTVGCGERGVHCIVPIILHTMIRTRDGLWEAVVTAICTAFFFSHKGVQL